jgi:hypothetical protein
MVVVCVCALTCGCTAEVAKVVAVSVLTLGNCDTADFTLVILVLVFVDGKFLATNITVVVAVFVSTPGKSFAALVAIVIIVCVFTLICFVRLLTCDLVDKIAGREGKQCTHHEGGRKNERAQFLKGGHLLRSSK